MSTISSAEPVRTTRSVSNGAAISAYLAAGIGTFALGLVVILNEVGLLTPPTLYAPAGGVSGRTTLAVVVWLISWAVLHARWSDRWIEPRRSFLVTLVLIALGLVLLLPPVWAVFE